jgi:hypothetical protein
MYYVTSEEYDDGSWTVESDGFLEKVPGCRTRYRWYLDGKKVADYKSPKGDYGDWIKTVQVKGRKSALVRGEISIILRDGRELPIDSHNFEVEPAEEDLGDEWYPCM